MDERELEELSDPGVFYFTGPVFVVAPLPRPAEASRLLRSFARGASKSADGQTRRFVAVFTDLDLAERHILEWHSDLAGSLKPLSFPTFVDFQNVLRALVTMGEKYVGLDPGATNVRVIDIPRILDAFPV